MRKFFSQSLAAQFIGLTLVALILAQALTFVISLGAYTQKFDATVKGEFITRASTVTRLVSTLPPETREQVLRTSEAGYLRYWLTNDDSSDANTWRLAALSQLTRPLDPLVDPAGKIAWSGSARPDLPDENDIATANATEGWRDPTPYSSILARPAKALRFAGSRGFGFKTQLDDGIWLNAAFYQHGQASAWTPRSLASLALTAVILALIGAFIASRIARPLRELARSAEALGRGENLPPLAETGPDEIRRTAESFNTMQRRLHRFVEDRTKMLAAIGHDLRTPLTSLRLRAEFVSSKEVQQKMLSTIDELEAMTEAAIAFARGDSTTEPTRVIELEALVGSICDDQNDLANPVVFVEGTKLNYRCRPAGLKRAVRNLVENAVRYGVEAKVFVRLTGSTVDVVVQDRGPGIPAELAERVFTPFFRVETSRNRDTGGVGLGLSIARAVVRQHGGDILFANVEGGMQAIISLPKDGVVASQPTHVKREVEPMIEVAASEVAISLRKR